MKRAFLFAFLVCCAVSALSLAEDPSVTEVPAEEFNSNPTTKPSTTTTIKPTTTTTTVKPTTTTTTVKPTTTTTTIKPTTTTTTIKPTTTTTTIKPTTTTKPPTTTTTEPPTTNATTTKPPTTTKHATTTPKPPPPPPQPTPSTNLTVGNYNVTDSKKVICLRAEMALQIRLVTPKANGTYIVQPKLTKAEGGCQDTTANLTLVFTEGFITFLFNKSAADKTAYVDALIFNLSYPLIKDSKIPYIAKNTSVHLFNAKIGHSYSCKSESLYMGNGLYLDVNKDRMQAFDLTKSHEFGTPDACAADQPDYRVAIAVGVTLLVLIVVVVVAYLLGRRRRTDGYQSL